MLFSCVGTIELVFCDCWEMGQCTKDGPRQSSWRVTNAIAVTERGNKAVYVGQGVESHSSNISLFGVKCTLSGFDPLTV